MDNARDTVGQPIHLVRPHAALCNPGSTQPDAGGQSGDRITGDRLLVDHDAGQFEDARYDLAIERLLTILARARASCCALEIDQEQVSVCSPIGQLQVAPDQSGGQGLRVLDNATLQIAKSIAAGDLERHAHGGKLVGVRPALQAGEHGRVDLARQVRLGGQDARPPGAAQRFVGGKGHHIGNAHRVGILAGHHHACRMGNVGHEIGAHCVRDLAKAHKIGRPGVGGIPGNDQLGMGCLGEGTDLVIVKRAVSGDLVRNHVVALARHVEFRAVRQVPALKEIEAHQGIAQLEQRIVHGQVGHRSGKGLHVDVNLVRSSMRVGKAGRCPSLSQGLDQVNVICSLVKAAVGITAIGDQLLGQVGKQVFVVAHHLPGGIALGVHVGKH